MIAPLAPLTGRAHAPSPAALAAVPAHHATRISGAAIVLAAFAALLALGCIAWAIGRLLAYEPHWALSLRHTLAEAGFRASATWAEFSDWARLGR